MAYTAIYSADFIFEKTPLRLHSNVKEFGVKRKGVLVETQKSFVLNVSAFWGTLKHLSESLFHTLFFSEFSRLILSSRYTATKNPPNKDTAMAQQRVKAHWKNSELTSRPIKVPINSDNPHNPISG